METQRSQIAFGNQIVQAYNNNAPPELKKQLSNAKTIGTRMHQRLRSSMLCIMN
jgi:hypothetical protein